MQDERRAGFSMIGMLITLVCIVILFSISMSAINRAVTGEGSTRGGTVRSVQDQMTMTGIYQSLVAGAEDFRGSRYITPSLLTGSEDKREDTTANLYSAMVALNYATPEMLIAANEYSGYVQVMWDYDYDAYQPSEGRFWDPRFEADLHRLSNVSWAHMPLIGERYARGWRASMSPRVLLLGNRGPEEGKHNPASWTYGRDGTWAGQILLGDGSVKFIDTFTPPQFSIDVDGEPQPDNIFAMETGPQGDDAIIAFTREMTRDGPVLQYD